MKLNIGERYRVAQLLPEKSNFETLKILRDLKGELSPSEKEKKKCNIRREQEGGEIFLKWDDEEYAKEIKFGETTTAMIVKKLKKLEDEESLIDVDISIYEKFVEKK